MKHIVDADYTNPAQELRYNGDMHLYEPNLHIEADCGATDIHGFGNDPLMEITGTHHGVTSRELSSSRDLQNYVPLHPSERAHEFNFFNYDITTDGLANPADNQTVSLPTFIF